MSHPVLTSGAAQCPHEGGVAPPGGAAARVRIAGAAVLTTASPVEGCRAGAGEKFKVAAKPRGAAAVEIAIEAPCGEVRWAHAANRLKVGGHAALIAPSEGKTASGAAITGRATQARVKAT